MPKLAARPSSSSTATSSRTSSPATSAGSSSAANMQCAQCHDSPARRRLQAGPLLRHPGVPEPHLPVPERPGADGGHRREGRGRRQLHERLRQGQEAERRPPAEDARRQADRGAEAGEGERIQGRAGEETCGRSRLQPPRALAAAMPSENPAFARNAVNRFWAMMMGRGIVHPVDLDHGGQPAVAPRTARPACDGVRRAQVRREVAGPRAGTEQDLPAVERDAVGS